MAKPKRAIVYIDGYNLYYGLCEANWRRYLWLDVGKLGKLIVPPNHKLVCVKFFTARVSKPEDRKRRQTNYLDAIATNKAVRIIEGRHKRQAYKCRKCDYINYTTVEKRTDVNIAINMLGDAYDGQFDTAVLVSGDTDFCDLVSMICGSSHARARGKVVIAFPPKRANNELRRAAAGSFQIGQDKFRKTQFPNALDRGDGYILRRPGKWTKAVDEENIRKKLKHEKRRGGIDAASGSGMSLGDVLKKAKRPTKAKKSTKAKKATKPQKAQKHKPRRRR